ncbi:DNA cytosine methyltransferase [Achromobacter mucicolens]|uniref:DNA cytosine methyltransferase n=1 Tax=Achromobacter mucicolens TaxID=1389922 RepID=UPI003B9C57B1
MHPDDLRSYTQCHFFAGIGVWSYALRRAGWPDDRPVWTGSCPCQPFSAAGKGTAFDDERHLWPAWHWLIQECRPPVVFGEQVASKDAEPWLDLVSTDLEALGFATAAVAFPSASVGAPHKRDRTYFVAHAAGAGREWRGPGKARYGRNAARVEPERFRDASRMADAQQHDHRCQAATADHNRPQADGSADRAGGCGSTPCRLGDADGERAGRDGRSIRGQVDSQDRQFGADDADAPGSSGKVAHADGRHTSTERQQRSGEQRQQPQDRGVGGMADALLQQRPDGQSAFSDEHDAGGRHEGAATLAGLRGDMRPGPVNGFWRAADWLLCRDGKWRPVEPGTFPLAHGAPARVGRLRAYGNAINAQQAQIFIEEGMKCL